MIRNTILGIIKTHDGPPETLRIQKHTMRHHPANRDMLVLRVATGWKRYLKKVPDKLFKTVRMPAAWVTAYPGGLNNAIENPDTVKFVCGLREECQAGYKTRLLEYTKENAEMSRELIEAKSGWGKSKMELEATITKLRAQLSAEPVGWQKNPGTPDPGQLPRK